MKKQKQSNPIKVMAIVTAVLLVVAFAALAAGNGITLYRRGLLADLKADVQETNRQLDADYAAAVDEYNRRAEEGSIMPWPEAASEGWDVVDLTNFPLEDAQSVTLYRAEIMNNGMLLVNEWHSRPDDFSEAALVKVGSYTRWEIGVNDGSVQLFPHVVDALMTAVKDAAALGLQNYMVSEGYRTWDTQNTYFTRKMEELADDYSGDALVAAAKKEVNYPGTSEFNSGLSFTLRRYKQGDAEVNGPAWIDTDEGKWMNENCWRYGIVFRFPLADYPSKGTADKSYKTGVSVDLNLYRYVGKGNSHAMHVLDLCLEEYIEYLQEHPHIAIFEDGVLRYEIVRQYVGEDAQSFDVTVTGSRAVTSTVSSLDNMGGVITVFTYGE